MTKNKTNNTITTTAPTPADAYPSQAMVNQQHSLPISALSQQLEQVSLDKGPQYRHSSSSSSPKRKPSSKRKSKSDFGTGSGTDLPQPQAKSKRSPKSNKVNGVKQFSTPSKMASTPNGHPYGPATQDLAAHYAGPTFHSSPAPSSLPMPSFFASSKGKSVVPNGSEQDSPPNQSTPVKPLRSANGQVFLDQDDSPLAPFFKADREEKNRLRNKHSTDSGVFGSPTQRPASAGGIPDHLNLRSESPLLWNDSPQKVNGRFDLRSKEFYFQC
jgi:Proline-rich nuclear receptor coactivator motif